MLVFHETKTRLWPRSIWVDVVNGSHTMQCLACKTMGPVLKRTTVGSVIEQVRKFERGHKCKRQ